MGREKAHRRGQDMKSKLSEEQKKPRRKNTNFGQNAEACMKVNQSKDDTSSCHSTWAMLPSLWCVSVGGIAKSTIGYNRWDNRVLDSVNKKKEQMSIDIKVSGLLAIN